MVKLSEKSSYEKQGETLEIGESLRKKAGIGWSYQKTRRNHQKTWKTDEKNQENVC